MNANYFYYNFSDCSKVSEEFLKAYLVIFENWSVEKVTETSKPDLVEAVTTFEKNRTPSRKEFSICIGTSTKWSEKELKSRKASLFDVNRVETAKVKDGHK